MKRPNITPEKWKKRTAKGKTIVCREDSQAVGVPLDVCRVWQSSFTEANAQAIAALPELLTALEDTYAGLSALWAIHTKGAQNDTLDAAKAALTKAGYTFD